MEQEFLNEYENVKKILDANKNEHISKIATIVKERFGLDDVSNELLIKWIYKWQKKYKYSIKNQEETIQKNHFNNNLNEEKTTKMVITLNNDYRSSGKNTVMVRIEKKLYDEIKAICKNEGIQYHILLNSLIDSILERGIIIKRDDIQYSRNKP